MEPNRHSAYGRRRIHLPLDRKRIQQGVAYDLDHILPLAVYPTNELWNLMPSDPKFNSHRKRDRLPEWDTLQKASAHMQTAYTLYEQEAKLAVALKEDVAVRFSTVGQGEMYSAAAVTTAVIDFVHQLGQSRNLARF